MIPKIFWHEIAKMVWHAAKINESIKICGIYNIIGAKYLPLKKVDYFIKHFLLE